MLKRFAITGATGLLGSNLALDFQSQGYTVVALDRLAFPPALGIEIATGDLADTGWTEDIFRQTRPDCVIHCAAATNVDWCEEHPLEAHQANVAVTRTVAEAARRISASFVYISTDSVFDGVRGGYTEDHTPHPLNAYARTKLAGERAAQEVLPESLIVRTNIYGWNLQPKASLAEWIVGRLGAGEAVPAFDDVIFAPILVNDLGRAIASLLCLGHHGVYHVAARDSCSKREFARYLAVGFDLPMELIERSAVATARLIAPRPRNTWLETSKVAKALGEAMPSVTEGVARFRTLRDSGFASWIKSLGETQNGNFSNR